MNDRGKEPFAGLASFLFEEYRETLDRYEALQREDDELRAAEYAVPDPRRRRLRVSCNDCRTPFCCNQLVSVDLLEALVLYRWAARHAPAQLQEAVERGEESLQRAPVNEVEFFQRRRPCPFLVKGQCAVYPARPYACRTHYMGGAPLKCRDQLQPKETYSMDPDGGLVAGMKKLSEDLRFFAQIESVEPHELSQLLYLVHRLGAVGGWSAPTRLDWQRVGETPRPPTGRRIRK